MKTGKLQANDDSDIEMEGIDQDLGDEEADIDDTSTEDFPSGKDDDERIENKLAEEEAKELEETKRERMELITAEQNALAETSKIDSNTSHEEKLEYLMKQSDVFAHFLAGSLAASKGKNKGKKTNSNRGKMNRMTEAEEDAQLLKSAQSNRRTIRLDKQPSNLASECKMHAYQLEGLNWLIKIHDHGINGILADEMGLGKTLQTISLLAYLRESRGVKGPHLIIVPKSVVGNWMRELKRWCPSIRAIRMGGTKDERRRIIDGPLKIAKNDGKFIFDVLVTSYEGILKEKGSLAKVDWKYLIIDEAHRIKNENSSLSIAVRALNTDFRLLITGTPLQNNLHELWALLNFLLPEIFGNAEQFDEWFSMSDGEGKQNVIKKLHSILRPFMIRRVKKDVACNLPPKKETKLYVGLTSMQQEWYKKVLRKDAFELNKLGGPDRVRLLNIVMQLRKVCNHPYLFDGAEAGPPYTDGPHLWLNSGKMLLLHKLLIKLKEKGSRVLIFSQMTRVLDIMEDYMRLTKSEYCRIDGNTSSESRDSQMDVFNAPDSTKFCFLLSTRAGGLGINLATADIVILFDSDWNPQVDLQAMDRAHRIGQKKPVQVFRFITEGSIEEKIIERADRKLFLDAAVIQQGRLAEQHTTVGKDDLMKMVKFGADQILSGKGGSYTDEDIDALIAKGEERTQEMQAKLKTDAQHNLASFSLLGEDEGVDTFDFNGENYREKNKNAGNFINLPQRERKRNYNVDEYFQETIHGSAGARASNSEAKKRKKKNHYHDFQLYDVKKLEDFNNREQELAKKRTTTVEEISRLRARMRDERSTSRRMNLQSQLSNLEVKLASDFDLTAEEKIEKDKLVAEGFPDWSRKDFRSFCSSLERHGRFDVINVVKDVMNECGKAENEVKRYFVKFWMHYQRISEWKKILEKVERGEKKIHRLRQIKEAINDKIQRHISNVYAHLLTDKNAPRPPSSQLLDKCWQSMRLYYGPGTKLRSYNEEEDAFLLCMMHKHGYGATERIRMEIRRAWQFRFDWYFKSRSSQDIHRRCETVVKCVIEEQKKREKEKERAEMQRRQREATGLNEVIEIS